MMHFITATPRKALSIAVLFSALALFAALFSEVALGLEPCKLCIYQRIPFVLVIIMGGIALAVKRFTPAVLGFSAITFAANAVIAFYHSGVERHWWVSAFEGCTVPNFAKEPQNILENILSAPSARCDEIPWQDPLIGLSMANYNVIFCLALAGICIFTLLRLRAKP